MPNFSYNNVLDSILEFSIFKNSREQFPMVVVLLGYPLIPILRTSNKDRTFYLELCGDKFFTIRKKPGIINSDC